MIPNIEIIDNFLDNPYAVKTIAENLDFRDIEYEGALYANMCEGIYWKEFRRHISVPPRFNFFRCGDGNRTNTYVHSDELFGVKTAILYLNTEEEMIAAGVEKDGTVFYRHLETGLYKPNGKLFMDFRDEKYRDPKMWKAYKKIGMKFNRLIFYDSPYFHSRISETHWPGRLVQVLFF